MPPMKAMKNETGRSSFVFAEINVFMEFFLAKLKFRNSFLVILVECQGIWGIN